MKLCSQRIPCRLVQVPAIHRLQVRVIAVRVTLATVKQVRTRFVCLFFFFFLPPNTPICMYIYIYIYISIYLTNERGNKTKPTEETHNIDIDTHRHRHRQTTDTNTHSSIYVLHICVQQIKKKTTTLIYININRFFLLLLCL